MKKKIIKKILQYITHYNLCMFVIVDDKLQSLSIKTK